jgi:hypothetical protein
MTKFWKAGAVGLLLIAGTVLGQLSQSGGAAVISARQSGTWAVTAVTACGTEAFDSGILSVPAAAVAVTAADTCVDAVVFVNTTAFSQSVTLTDNQSSPVAYLNAFQIPANSTLVYDLHHARLAGGIRWQAAQAASLNAQIVGLQ